MPPCRSECRGGALAPNDRDNIRVPRLASASRWPLRRQPAISSLSRSGRISSFVSSAAPDPGALPDAPPWIGRVGAESGPSPGRVATARLRRFPDLAELDRYAEFLMSRPPPIERTLIDAERVGHFLIGRTEER